MAGFLKSAASSQPKPDGASRVIIVQSVDAINELKNLIQIDIDHISGTDDDVSKHYIKGLISTVYPSFETRIRKTKKLVLKNCNSPKSLSTERTVVLFMLGEDVDNCDILKPGDVIIIKGFSFEKATVTGQKVQIVVDLQDPEAKIWVLRCKDASPTKEKQFNEVTVGSDIKRKPKRDRKNEFDLQRAAFKEATNKEKKPNAPNKLQKVLVAGGKKLQVLQSPKKLQYTKLATLKEIISEHKFVNIFAVVKYFKSPKKSKGKDYCMIISLVDDSSTSTDESFMCNLFAPSIEQLPAIKHVGDIVRFERIDASRFHGTINGVGNSRNNFKWMVFSGSVEAPIIPTASCSSAASASRNQVLSEEEQEMIQDLKTWASSNLIVPPKKTLSQISLEDLFFDVSCQVISVCMATNASCMILTVWDGTLPHCQSIPVAEIQKGESVVSDDDGLKVIPERMSFDIHLYDEHSHSAICPGDFVSLVNVHAIIPQHLKVGNTNQLMFIIHKGTINGRGVRKLSHDSQDAKEVQRQIASSIISTNQVTEPAEQRTGSKTENTATSLPRTLQTSCTITDFPAISFTSIEALKRCSKIPNKFRCRVKAMAFFPRDVKDFVQRCCGNCKSLLQVNSSSTKTSQQEATENMDRENEDQINKEKKEKTLAPNERDGSLECNAEKRELKTVEFDWKTSPKCSVCHQDTHLVYVFSLLIEDPTGILHVMLFDMEVTDFFPDLPTPEEFLTRPDSQTLVHEALVSITDNQTNELTAESQPEGGRPWMECCLMSYMVDQEVFYRMFGTTLI